ncbi:hypothetical protein IOD16_32670 [Saccharothrix sp. 6-C]|uniref:hypothetical protein n=1 Tax=Saccharothrix sp. 6-C TaxID=2781735 RepID=UPI001916D37E|nr:hypothetical protein [Saccharothrix sp. 6-C]QQQ75777.1 hypothetical protein IOD16_32670 [Saccharothrix sp. 6-C]
MDVTRTSSRSRPLRWLVVLVAAVALVGCQDRAEPAAKSGTGELRTDPEPLVERFPVLAALEGARWMSGTFGRADVPGPSTYWIDAVVTLPAAEVERVRSACAPADEGRAPDVVAGLRAELPGGPFLTGDALDAAFDHERWHVSAFLDPKSARLVLIATGT